MMYQTLIMNCDLCHIENAGQAARRLASSAY